MRILGGVNSKERKAIHMEIEKQMFGKQIFAGLHRDTGPQRRILTENVPVYTPK